MKKIRIISLLAIGFGSLILLVNCDTGELDKIECGDNSYIVTREAIYETLDDGTQISVRSNGVIQVDGKDRFPEAITLTIYQTVSEGRCTIFDCPTVEVEAGTFTIEANTPSPFTFVENVALFTRASIVAPSCPEPIEKSKEEIDNDTKEIECGNQGNLVINEDRCFLETVFTWESDVSLSGVTFAIYGVEIALSQGTSMTFNTSELDFEASEYTVSGTNAICSITTSLTQCAGFTGTVSLTDPIAAGDELSVTVTDYELAGSGDFSITISTNLGESEDVTLAETEVGSSVFVGTLTTQLSAEIGTNNDGTLNIQNGVTITATYNDEANDEGNAEAVVATVTVSGEFAPTCSDGIQNGDETGIDCGGSNCEACAVTGLTFEGTTYEITDATYLDIGADYILFTISRYEDVQVFSLDLEITSSTTIISQTYTFGDEDFGVAGYVAVDNVAEYATITGGYVILVITPSGDYAFEIDLMTDKGPLTGSYTVPSGF